ncbi:uncharacterized protein LOC135463948 isoform X2 [Liolophura sinensis]
MLFIYPMEEQQQHRHVQGNREDERGNREDERPYVVEKINPTAINFSDYIVSDSISRGIPESFRRVRRGTKKMSYDVELMMVTDSSVYRFWYERTTGSNPAERRTLTLSKITQYYAFVLNAVSFCLSYIRRDSTTRKRVDYLIVACSPPSLLAKMER